MREVAARLGCDPSTVTFLADRLQERELVERRVNPANRRSNTLALTPKGARVRHRLVEAYGHSLTDSPALGSRAAPAPSSLVEGDEHGRWEPDGILPGVTTRKIRPPCPN
jgi:hypothetical protein